MCNNVQFTCEHVQKSMTYLMNSLGSITLGLFTNGRFWAQHETTWISTFFVHNLTHNVVRASVHAAFRYCPIVGHLASPLVAKSLSDNSYYHPCVFAKPLDCLKLAVFCTGRAICCPVPCKFRAPRKSRLETRATTPWPDRLRTISSASPGRRRRYGLNRRW